MPDLADLAPMPTCLALAPRRVERGLETLLRCRHCAAVHEWVAAQQAAFDALAAAGEACDLETGGDAAREWHTELDKRRRELGDAPVCWGDL
ncbi:MAG TPA: hypothetical protein VNQ73_14390 [Ilumatobacter sp.]|nr:hypothetical protein [Ilumatobacter sp.]